MSSDSGLPSISFIIPTLNNENDLNGILRSIRGQKYPREKVEIIVADGGSTDATREIAERFGCRFFNNEKVLAEYGVALGMSRARGEILSVVASDNVLVGEDWIASITIPFRENDRVMVVTPTQVSTEEDHWITEYWLMFSDPFNHFVYWNACNARTYGKALPIISREDGYETYGFDYCNHPIIALAQGVSVRRINRTKENAGDDILPLIESVVNGDYELAWVPDALVEHHTVHSVGSFVRKQRWAIRNALNGAAYGVGARRRYFSFQRKVRAWLWPFYAISFILPLVLSLIMFFRSRERAWLYHAPLSWISSVVLWSEFIKCRIFRIKADYGRY